MRKILAVSLATLISLTACGGEPEVNQAEASLAVDPEYAKIETAIFNTPAATTNAWDLNNDGNLDRAEFNGFGGRVFGGWDGDRDERLSPTEFEAAWTAAGWRDASRAFTAFDDNSDSLLSNEEFFGDDEFGEWDKNSNGILESDEWFFGSAGA